MKLNYTTKTNIDMTNELKIEEIFEENAPELLVDIAEIIEAKLIEFQLTDDEKANNIAINITQEIAENWGGINVYIPKKLCLLTNARNLAIWKEFDGTNHSQLARKYRVSMQWIYKIINNMRAIEIKKNQRNLFDEN